MSVRRQAVPLVLLAALALPQSGCIGSFELTKKVYAFNREIGPIAVQEVVFLAFCIVPVYSIAGFADVVFLNVIEAVTGENPLAKGDGVQEVALADGATLRMERDGGTLRTELVTPGAAPLVRVFTATADGLTVRDEAGRTVLNAEASPGGGLALVDGHGALVAQYTAGDLRAAETALARGGAVALASALRASDPETALVDAEP